MTLRAYKYRLYPTAEQDSYLNHVFGSVRFVWNNLVANFNSWSSEGPNRPLNEKILKDMPEHSWLNDSISYALQQKRMDFDEAKSQFFSKTQKVKLGRMKFKKKGVSSDSFRIPGSVLPKSNKDMCSAGRLQLPKMDSMKVIIDRPFVGSIRQLTISKNKCSQYFVSVLVDEDIELKQNTNSSIGIDLGLNHFITCSNGMKIDNPRWFRKSQAKLKRAQQHLSRKQRGSTRYEKQRLKVAKIHLSIANQRSWFHHTLSTFLINNFDHIMMENLNVAGMKKSNLAKSVSDAGWSSFVSMLEYKSNWYGRSFVKIDRFYPSSKTCSSCGNKAEKMDLSIREWTCSTCGTNHDRDLNAANNILNKGLTDLYCFTSEELSDYRRGEVVSPEAILPKASSLNRLVTFIDFYKSA